MFHYDDPPVDDGPLDTWGGFRSLLRFYHDDITAPIGEGPVAPLPTFDNPNDD
jgi:hypothetical protein